MYVRPPPLLSVRFLLPLLVPFFFSSFSSPLPPAGTPPSNISTENKHHLLGTAVVQAIFFCSRNRRAVLFALLALVAWTSALETEHIFTNCGSSTDPIQVKNVTLTPDPPTKGTTLSVTQSGTSSLPINGGSVNVKVPVALYSASIGFLGCCFSCAMVTTAHRCTTWESR